MTTSETGPSIPDMDDLDAMLAQNESEETEDAPETTPEPETKAESEPDPNLVRKVDLVLSERCGLLVDGEIEHAECGLPAPLLYHKKQIVEYLKTYRYSSSDLRGFDYTDTEEGAYAIYLEEVGKERKKRAPRQWFVGALRLWHARDRFGQHIYPLIPPRQSRLNDIKVHKETA